MSDDDRTFELARMSPVAVAITWLYVTMSLVLPAGMWLLGRPEVMWWHAALIAALLWGLLVGVWLLMRPTCFKVGPDGVWIVWPVRRTFVPAGQIADVRAVTRQDLGLTMRVCGVGGLFGGFGRFWSRRIGGFSAYASGHDGLVMILRRPGRPLLITPSRPDEFIEALRNACHTAPPARAD